MARAPPPAPSTAQGRQLSKRRKQLLSCVPPCSSLKHLQELDICGNLTFKAAEALQGCGSLRRLLVRDVGPLASAGRRRSLGGWAQLLGMHAVPAMEWHGLACGSMPNRAAAGALGEAGDAGREGVLWHDMRSSLLLLHIHRQAPSLAADGGPVDGLEEAWLVSVRRELHWVPYVGHPAS